MFKRILVQLTRWRKSYLNDRNFLFLASIGVGLVVGLVSYAMKKLVWFIEHQLVNIQQNTRFEFAMLLFPMCGILLTVFIVQTFNKGKSGRGVSSIIHSVSRRSGTLSVFNIYRQFINGVVTVGFGGSTGLEAPIVVTGSSIGSNLARLFLLSPKERIVLLACGAAAGIASVFNTPVAGVLFAMEVLLTEFSIPTFIPVLLSAATGAVVARELGGAQLFTMTLQQWVMNAIPFYMLLGVFCGLVSVYFNRTHYWIETIFIRYKSFYPKALVGGFLLGVMVFLFPSLYGEGYHVLNELLQGRINTLLMDSHLPMAIFSDYMLFVVVICILFVKVFATSITISAGGGGGVFAPSLFTGAFAGLAFALFFKITGLKDLILVNFIAAGMVGLLSGVVHAPLTAIFLIAELTGGYTLFVPLMIVSATSYFISRAFEPYSIYTAKLARQGIILNNRESIVLQNIDIQEIITTDFTVLSRTDSLKKLIEIVSKTSQTIFPILNKEKAIEGLVEMDDLKPYLLKHEVYDLVLVKELMFEPTQIITMEDEMSLVMKKFDSSGSLLLPVVNTEGVFIGFASKTILLNILRKSITRRQLDFE